MHKSNGLSTNVKISHFGRKIGVRSVPYTNTNQDYLPNLPYKMALYKTCGIIAFWIRISNREDLFEIVNISYGMRSSKISYTRTTVEALTLLFGN